MVDSGKEFSVPELLFSDTTEFYADSVEWCPFNNFTQFVACGTYQLEENGATSNDSQTRKGNVTVYKISVDTSNQIKVDKINTFHCSGVLDMKWCPHLEDNPVLAVACSDGQVLLLELSKTNNSACLSSVSFQNLAENACNMILSLDWSDDTNGSMRLAASDTLGCLNYLEMRHTQLHLLNSWKAHDYECWIAALNYSQPHLIYSGGDDCCFKCWDVRNTQCAAFINKRHSMGVTAISKSKRNEHLLVTGSYDENVFLWDARSVKSPMSEISLGGGIWRLKWHPYDPNHLISASMHNGFHIVSMTDCSLKVVTHYKEHKSLAYGVDWGRKLDQSEASAKETNNFLRTKDIIGSCSFYDKLLHIWKINL